MEESVKVRLVRCPKCDKILPEYPHVAVYQCGGCGAILQAKNQSNSSGGMSAEKGVEEDLRDVSDALDRESNEIKLSQRRRERGFSNVTVDSSSTSSPRAEPKPLNENVTGLKYDPRSVEDKAQRNGRYARPSKDPVDSWMRGNDLEMNRNRDSSVGSKDPVDSWMRGNDLGMNRNRDSSVGSSMEMGTENDSPIDIASRSRRSGQIPSYVSGERDGLGGYRRTPRAVAEDVRFPKVAYPEEGSSSYYAGSYGLVEKNPTGSGGLDRVEHLEQDRAELLRKLNELNMIKDQLDRSRDGSVTPKERLPLETRPVPHDPYVGNGRDAWFPEGSSRQQHHGQTSAQPYQADNHTRRPLYSNHGLEPIPGMNRHNRDLHNFYTPQMHPSSEIPGYGDPFASQMVGVGPSNPPHQYQRHPSHDYYAAQYMEMEPDRSTLHPNTLFHQPGCSCAHCYNKHLRASRQVPPGVLPNQRFPDAAANPMFQRAENRGTFPPQGYHPRDVTPPPMHPEPLVRRQREPDAETSSLGQARPRRVLPVNRNRRKCHPIAGGAPFIVCHNCFELLPLQKKILQKEKNFRKLRCGACSTVMSLLFETEGVIVTIHEESKGVSPVINDKPVGVVKNSLHSRNHTNQTNGDYSGECDSSSYNSHYSEPSSLPMEERMTLSESEKPQGLASLCSTSDDEESLNGEREVLNSEDLSLEAKGTTPIPGSPLQEYSPSNQIASKFEKGNRSKRINHDEVPIKMATRQNSLKDASVAASVATEMDVSFSEYSNGGMSQEYGDVSKDSQPKASKSAAILGFLKQGLKDRSKSNQSVDEDNDDVIVNGRVISERQLRKAEKKAGTIHPGKYWYDPRAGFWGVMGQPCLGIIPPFIEELNYPMPENCAGGNTTICVNGRELHKKDLDLLANRGLPRTTYKSYIVDISGKVVDEVSRKELENLGKLAPTVQKLNHGFGMRVPRSLAQKLAS